MRTVSSHHQEKGELLLLEHIMLSDAFNIVTSSPRYIGSVSFHVEISQLSALNCGVYHSCSIAHVRSTLMMIYSLSGRKIQSSCLQFF